MLQIRHIRKEYVTGELHQTALDDVSLNLRDNEFVAILGPSGSGKTTLLNIIGGLDRYDSGDVIIDDVSTREYSDRDWDSYRNHTIGFVFQSYNLIPHQTILANVELALTISGVPRAERRKKAMDALEKVGLAEQAHKKPNQMSGGQMQRVAIARALVNDPDILLADEPTGALDTKTSVQIMDLLNEVAKDRLVVMVTHNPELARDYATRIVELKDGRIISDSDPFRIAAPALGEHRNMGRSSMSFLTSLALSFNNLLTKKGRTILTAFAGSIGIIGIALILSLSNGVNNYIHSVEEDTLSEYPIMIESTNVDFSAFMQAPEEEPDEEPDDAEVEEWQTISALFSNLNNNDLHSLKDWIESSKSHIHEHAKAVEYMYGVKPLIFRWEKDGVHYRQVNPDKTFSSNMQPGSMGMSAAMNFDTFYALPEEESLYRTQYEICDGRWPSTRFECVLVLSENSMVTDLTLYTAGLKDASELDAMMEQMENEETVEVSKDRGKYRYRDFIGLSFRLVDAFACYDYDQEYKVFVDKTENEAFMRELIRNGEKMEIVGVVKPREDAKATMLQSGIAYPRELIPYIMERAADSDIVKAQLKDPEKDVFSGKSFSEQAEDPFNMKDLFTIDEKAFAEAFAFDSSALAGADSFSNMDLSGISLDLSGLSSLGDAAPQIDIASFLSGLDVDVSEEAMMQLFSNLLADYLKEAAKDPRTDYANMGRAIQEYLQSGSAAAVLRDDIQDILFDYITSLPFPIDFDDLPEISVSDEQLQKILTDLSADYMRYAAEHEVPDPSLLPSSFAAYLSSESGQRTLMEGVKNAVDMDSLNRQISAKMAEMMGGYASAMSEVMASVMQQAADQIMTAISEQMAQAMASLTSNMENLFKVDPEALAKAIKVGMSAEDFKELMMSMATSGQASYDSNLKKLNYAREAYPTAIYIYPKDFENKAVIIDELERYNREREKAGEDDKIISYTDYVGTLMSSVTDIIDVISYVLIAFVAISLIVSSIMIGIITYISVLERTKEIGILRAIGASKRNISQVFNAETFIIGLLAGVIGIGATLLILIPGNMLIHSLTGNQRVSAVLPVYGGVLLIIISVILTLIGGLIPSRAAARKDPVTALRTE